MKKLQLLFCLIFASAFAHNAIASSSFSKATTIGAKGRDAAIMFAIGNDFYIGGGEGYKDFWVYNSDSNTLRKLPDIPGTDSARAFSVGFTIGNKGYVGLGYDGVGNPILKNDLWQFDQSTSKWTQKANFIGDARDGAFVFVVGNVAYIGGGSNNVDLYDDFYAYNALTNKWVENGNLPIGYSIFTAAFTVNNTGYITGGQSGQTETKATYQYDTTDDTWNQMADFPGAARQTAIAMVISNMAYVGLGQSQYSTTYSDFYSYNPTLDQWAKIDTFQGGRRAWSCAASNGAQAYFAFGWDLASNVYNDLWAFGASFMTGIDPIKSSLSGISLYPDPAQDYLYFSSDNKIKIISLSVNDVNGRTLKTVNPDGIINDSKINISGLSKGVYFLKINSDQAVESKKFIVY